MLSPQESGKVMFFSFVHWCIPGYQKHVRHHKVLNLMKEGKKEGIIEARVTSV